MVESQRFVTVAEAARKLDRSTEQVRRYLREGRLSGQRFGGQWFIERSTLNQFGDDLTRSRSFLDKISPASVSDPLAGVIAIGRGGGDIAKGKEQYRSAYRWRRS